MSDSSYDNDRAPQIPGAEPLTVGRITFSSPLGDGVVSAGGRLHFRGQIRPAIIFETGYFAVIRGDDVIVSVDGENNVTYADGLTLDDAQYAIEQLLRWAGAIE